MNKYRLLFTGILLLWASQFLFAQHSLYDMHFGSVDNRPVDMAKYKGKKLLIVVTNPVALQAKSSVRYLGAIQKSYPDVAVLVIPVADSAESPADDVSFTVKTAVSNTRYSVVVAAKEKAQHPLLQWLSDSRHNHHFDVSVKNDGQFFVISESGVLYAVLEKGVSDAVLKKVLTAGDVKPQRIITDINQQGYVPAGKSK